MGGPARPVHALDTLLRTVPWHQYLSTASGGVHDTHGMLRSTATRRGPHPVPGERGKVSLDLCSYYSVTELAKASCVGSEWRSKDPPNAARARDLGGSAPGVARQGTVTLRVRTVLCVWPSPATMRSARPRAAWRTESRVVSPTAATAWSIRSSKRRRNATVNALLSGAPPRGSRWLLSRRFVEFVRRPRRARRGFPPNKTSG